METTAGVAPLDPSPRAAYEFLVALKPLPWRLHGIFPERGKLPSPLPDWWYMVRSGDAGEGRPASMHNTFASTFDDVERFVAQCTEAGLNAYYACNRGVTLDRKSGRRRRDFPHKLDASEITHLDYLQVDLDLKDVPEDFLAWPEAERLEWYAREKARLRTRIAETLQFTPTFIVDTGGGLQVLLKVADPLEVTDPDVAAGYNKALESLFPEADSTHNIDRIFRLPGTINWPDEKKRERGRVPVLAKQLQYNDGAVVDLSDLTPGTVEPRARQEVELGELVRLAEPADLDQYVDASLHGQYKYERLKVLMMHGHDPEDPRKDETGSDNSGNGWTFDFASNALRAGVPNEVMPRSPRRAALQARLLAGETITYGDAAERTLVYNLVGELRREGYAVRCLGRGTRSYRLEPQLVEHRSELDHSTRRRLDVA